MKHYLFTFLLFILALPLSAQYELPTVSPTMSYVDKDDQVVVGETQYDGEAPLDVTFTANPQNIGLYTPLYEWRFTRNGESKPFLVRYDEETSYTFVQSGTFTVTLAVSFVQGTDTIAYEQEEPFVLSFAESKLEVPNAFTPNGDGINDIFKVKEGYRSIISFKATVCNRWGKNFTNGQTSKTAGTDAMVAAKYQTALIISTSRPKAQTERNIISKK